MTKLNKRSIGVFKRLTRDRVEKAMSNYKNQKADAHAYGSVKAINEDGSYQVQLNASSTTTRCANFCTANVGDRVEVLIKANGKCDVIGRLGGTIGGGGADWVEDFGEEGDWTWVKYASGIAECWLAVTISISSWYAWGTGYLSHTSSRLTSRSYPFEFLETPTVVPGITDLESNWEVGAVMFGGSTTESPSVDAFRPSTGSSETKNYSFMLQVRGLWKELERPSSGGSSGGGGTTTYAAGDVSDWIAGKVFAYAGSDAPIGCLLCDGRAVSRREYWELFAAIGTTYGAGDGSTTFNLPNIESRTIIGESDSYALGSTGGEETHQLTEDELPNLRGSMYFRNWTWGGGSEGTIVADANGIASHGGKVWSGYDTLKYGESTAGVTRIDIDFGSDQPHNNMQPYIVMRYFITTGKGDPVSGINPADYVVEWGNEGGWNWRKYASGWAECWREIQVSCSATNGYGGLFYESKGPYSFPFSFKSAPNMQATTFMGNGLWNVSVHTLTSSSFYFYAQSSTSLTGTPTFMFHASGFWKDSPASGGTETIAPTIAERFEALENEAVVASGTSDGWDWIKFANGLAYCEKKVLVSWVSPVSTWGNAYQSSSLYSCGGYPFAFKSTPVVSVTIEGSGQGNYMTGTWTVGQTFGTTTSPPQVWLMNNNGSTSYDKGGYLNTKAFGRWK